MHAHACTASGYEGAPDAAEGLLDPLHGHFPGMPQLCTSLRSRHVVTTLATSAALPPVDGCSDVRVDLLASACEGCLRKRKKKL